MSNLFVPSRKSAAIRITSLLAVLSALSLTGCASMINGSKQSIKIETVDAATGAHKPAICHISKRGLSISGKSTDTFEVGRGDDHMPKARPAMMFVACPVVDASAIFFTGYQREPV